jgi:hypothetical protein
MILRGLSRVSSDFYVWATDYLGTLLERMKPVVFIAFGVWIYSLVKRGSLPGRYEDIFLWVVLIQAVSAGHSSTTGSPLVRKLLSAFVDVVSEYYQLR